METVLTMTVSSTVCSGFLFCLEGTLSRIQKEVWLYLQQNMGLFLQQILELLNSWLKRDYSLFHIPNKGCFTSEKTASLTTFRYSVSDIFSVGFLRFPWLVGWMEAELFHAWTLSPPPQGQTWYFWFPKVILNLLRFSPAVAMKPKTPIKAQIKKKGKKWFRPLSKSRLEFGSEWYTACEKSILCGQMCKVMTSTGFQRCDADRGFQWFSCVSLYFWISMSVLFYEGGRELHSVNVI